jgi:Ca2+-binding EF-hand superfamily protein
MVEAEEDDAWDDKEFDECYQEFDYDGNGTISKQELTLFIKRFAAL